MRTLKYNVSELPNVIIPLGMQGERNALTVQIDLTEWADDEKENEYGVLIVMNPDGVRYGAATEYDDETHILSWQLGQADTGTYGNGAITVDFWSEGTLTRSVIARTHMLPSYYKGLDPAPDPYEVWLETMSQHSATAGAAANQAKASAEAAAQSEAAAAQSESVTSALVETVKDAVIGQAVLTEKIELNIAVTDWTQAEGGYVYTIERSTITPHTFANICIDESILALRRCFEWETADGILTIKTELLPTNTVSGYVVLNTTFADSEETHNTTEELMRQTEERAQEAEAASIDAQNAATAAGTTARELAEETVKLDAMAASFELNEIRNAIQPVFDPVSTDSHAGAIVSDIITPTDGHLYFGYALATIADLTGYTYGHMCLRFLNAGVYDCLDKIAGNSKQPLANGELELYGTFTPTGGKNIKALLRSFNSASAYTYKATISKLYLLDLTSAGITEEEALAMVRSRDYAPVRYAGTIRDGVINRKQFAEEVQQFIPIAESAVVDCWGDSLTQGTSANQTPYPAALAALLGSGFTVNNCGVGGERAEDIAFRQGGLPAICQPVTIGSGSGDKNYITVRSLDGADMTATMRQGTGNSTVYLGGDKYLLRKDTNGVYLLMGDGAEAGRVYDRPTLLQAEGAGTEHIAVIMIGQNGWGAGAPGVRVTGTEDGIVIEHAADPATLANVIDAMIAHNNGPFIVCGIPSGSAESRRALECELGSRYGEHFVNVREYVSAYGLADAGLTPTAADTAAMAKGEIPPQLMSDSVHLTDAGMAAVAKCIHARGARLGYWEVV